MGKRRSFLLYPPALIFGLITAIRNYLYDSGILSSTEFGIPVICIGNITVGGTGKTPHVEYLAALLRKEFRIAVLSRGYKRRSAGFRIASPGSGACDIGDEPLQIALKFPDIIVAVDNDRVNGVENLLKNYPDIDAIILDDGFQHRKIKPGFSILLTDYHQPMQEDFMLPYGNLRESIKNIKRADMVVITKAPPDISMEDLNKTAANLNEIFRKKVFITSLSYEIPQKLFENSTGERPETEGNNSDQTGAVVITGIASPDPFVSFARNRFSETIHLNFPDHHNFTEKDMRKIIKAYESLKTPYKSVVTTEKDSVRLRELAGIPDHIKEALYYIPVRITFPAGEKNEFDNIIIDYVRKNKPDNDISQI
ncbi:MAG: tetraacyldisaccharide 4'-kinase [Bacteroidales bacterium]|nr:tetraacyldisaccharide 4'-kinase [Bacteroidales bacterium]